MDPHGGIHSCRLRAEFANQVSPIPSVLPLGGWTCSLQQLPTFNYGYLYAHLVTDSKAIAENQWSIAAAIFGAGAMKHKEEGYCSFCHDQVQMVWFPPGFAIDSHCLFRGIVKPSFKTTGSYSTVVALSKISGYVLGARCSCKPELVDVVDMLLHCCVTFSTMLNIIPEDKTCTDIPHNKKGQEIDQVMVQFCFPKYSLCTFLCKT